ncbi:hypothetical protein [Lactiplantibacillus plantarum]|uniref:hypothetical protein n=1 Tax=Lactiplantibacillus plantarum TaxID=1590 RepID=UPI000977BA3B|nr:hypothetical protein [Lactiplantibacillus plantarum]
MRRYGILDTTAGCLLQYKVFESNGLAHQWLVTNYPSLYDTDNKRGHYLGGQRQAAKVLNHPIRIVALEGA